MGRMKTTEQFKNELKIINSDLTVIGEYIGVFNPITIKCNTCDYAWDTATPSNLLKGRKCPKCFILSARGNIKLSLSEVDELLKPFGERMSPYVNRHTPILIKTVEGYLAFAVIAMIQNGQGVPIFEKRNNHTIHNIILWLTLNNKPLQLVSTEYENCAKPMLWKCINSLCKNENTFSMNWNDVRGNHGCPICNESKGEKAISNYLIKNKIAFERQYKFVDCRNKNPLPFDFVVFKQNKLLALIEYDGQQHFEPRVRFGGEKAFIQTKCNDKIKNEYCKENKIILIRIPWKIKNIEQFLENKLNELEVI